MQGAVAGAGSGGGEKGEYEQSGSGRGLRWGLPAYLSPCCAAILSAFVRLRNIVHQERLAGHVLLNSQQLHKPGPQGTGVQVADGIRLATVTKRLLVLVWTYPVIPIETV